MHSELMEGIGDMGKNECKISMLLKRYGFLPQYGLGLLLLKYWNSPFSEFYSVLGNGQALTRQGYLNFMLQSAGPGDIGKRCLQVVAG